MTHFYLPLDWNQPEERDEPKDKTEDQTDPGS